MYITSLTGYSKEILKDYPEIDIKLYRKGEKALLWKKLKCPFMYYTKCNFNYYCQTVYLFVFKMCMLLGNTILSDMIMLKERRIPMTINVLFLVKLNRRSMVEWGLN